MLNFSKTFELMAEENEAIAALLTYWPYALGGLAILFVLSLLRGSRRPRAATQSMSASTRLSDADLATYKLEGTTAPVPEAPQSSMDDFFSNAERKAEVHGGSNQG